MINKRIKLTNDVELPLVGFGTWKIKEKEIIKSVLDKAYKNGYRLIDTAAVYANEIAISKAINDLGIDRRQICICDKVWNTSRSYEKVRTAFTNSCKKLKTNYIDVYLVHWPASRNIYDKWKEINSETWSGMESLYKEKKVRVIGVCNYNIEQLEELRKTAKIMPMINQIEFHPGMYDKSLFDYCSRNSIQLMASSPLGNGAILNNPTLKEIANSKNKTTAQICLRWILEKKVIAIPKTTNDNRIMENINLFDFELNEKETKILDEMDYCGGLNIQYEEDLNHVS